MPIALLGTTFMGKVYPKGSLCGKCGLKLSDLVFERFDLFKLGIVSILVLLEPYLAIQLSFRSFNELWVVFEVLDDLFSRHVETGGCIQTLHHLLSVHGGSGASVVDQNHIVSILVDCIENSSAEAIISPSTT